ncbi:MAG TPA: retropepsin-like aspartic protease [Candidatus Baltobacteraceae bacterium]|nr:retropepsin-like aspartic protease [Candidatus Baltobacteraceae bacterium]
MIGSGLDGTRATIPVQVDGHTERCVLDTGASVMLLSQDVARDAGLQFGTPLQEIAPDGRRYADYQTTIDTFAAGSFTANNLPARISSNLPSNVMLCGYDFLSRVPTLIDRDHNQVTLFPASGTVDRMHCSPIDLTPRVPLGSIDVNGKRIDNVVLDSGMTGGGVLWGGAGSNLMPAQYGMNCGQNAAIAFYDGGPVARTSLCTSGQRPDGYNGVIETNLSNVHQIAIDYPGKRICF